MWMRLLAAVNVAWGGGRGNAVNVAGTPSAGSATPGQSRKIAGKLVAISSVGTLDNPAPHAGHPVEAPKHAVPLNFGHVRARRPGLQSRWKGNDRIAI